MAYCTPYAFQGFCDPTSLNQMHPVSTPFDLDPSSAGRRYPHVHANSYGSQRTLCGNQPTAELYATPPAFRAHCVPVAVAPRPVVAAQSGYISSPALFQSHEELYASQLDSGSSCTVYAPPRRGSIYSTSSAGFNEKDAIVPACLRNHEHERCASIPWPDTSTPPRAFKRESADDGIIANDSNHNSPISEHIPARRKRTSASVSRTAKSKKPPLPAHFQPIKVRSGSGGFPRCPMPKCGVELEDRDAIWRGHFKRFHHDDLCFKPDCHGLGASGCKARCPMPKEGCNACGDDHTASTMTIESIGRHLLNVHIKVAYRCPVCGVENQWRESACARHIRRCLEKQKAMKKRRAC